MAAMIGSDKWSIFVVQNEIIGELKRKVNQMSKSTRPDSVKLAMRLVSSVVLCTALSVGCSKREKESDVGVDATTDEGRPKVALIMKSLANEFFSTMADGATTHQGEHADQYELVVNGIKDERDLSRQVALVEEMVAGGADAIVIAPADSQALVPALRRAKEKGVVIINIDNRLDAAILAEENVQIPFVGPDNKAGAKKVGEFLATKLNKGDQVAILEGIRSSFNAQQRLAGFNEAMDEAGMEIVSSQSAQWK